MATCDEFLSRGNIEAHAVVRRRNRAHGVGILGIASAAANVTSFESGGCCSELAQIHPPSSLLSEVRDPGGGGRRPDLNTIPTIVGTREVDRDHRVIIPTIAGILLRRAPSGCIIPRFIGIFTLQTTVTSPEELGLLVRAVRRSSQVRIDDLAAMARVSKQFATDVELGKPTVRLGLVFQILNELGLKVSVEVPASAQRQLVALRSYRVRRLPNKRSAAATSAEVRLIPNRRGHQGPAAGGGGKKD